MSYICRGCECNLYLLIRSSRFSLHIFVLNVMAFLDSWSAAFMTSFSYCQLSEHILLPFSALFAGTCQAFRRTRLLR